MGGKRKRIRKGGFQKRAGPRNSRGHLIHQDQGTDESRRRRLSLVRGADPVLAQSPMGVLVARDLIDATVWKSVERYAAAKRKRFGSGRPTSVDWMSPGHSHDNSGDEGEAAAKVLIERTDEVFTRRPPFHRSLFDDFAVFQIWPDWMIEGEWCIRALPDLAAIVEIACELDAVLQRFKPARTIPPVLNADL